MEAIDLHWQFAWIDFLALDNPSTPGKSHTKHNVFRGQDPSHSERDVV